MPVVAVQSWQTFAFQSGSGLTSTLTFSLGTYTQRAMLLFVDYGTGSGATGTPLLLPTMDGVTMSSVTSFSLTGHAVSAHLMPISDSSTADVGVQCVKNASTNNFMCGVALLLSGTSTSGVSSQATGRTSVATGGFPTAAAPTSVNSDMVFGWMTNTSGSTVTHTQIGEGNPIVSNMTAGGGSASIYMHSVSLVSMQGDSSVSMQWNMQSSGAADASQRFRAISIIMPVTTVADPPLVPAGVNVESFQTYGIQLGASRSTTTFTLGSGTTRVLLVFGSYQNQSSGTPNGPSVAPTFAGVSLPVFARPLTGSTSLMPMIYALTISDGSTGDYPLVCVKDAVNDNFEGVGVVLSNALFSGLSYTFAQSLSSGPAALPAALVPSNVTLDYVFGFMVGASGSTMTYTQFGDGTPIVSSMTPGGSTPGIYVPSLSLVTSKGDSSVSLLWQISDGLTDSQRWRLFGLKVPVADDGTVTVPTPSYLYRRRLHSFDW